MRAAVSARLRADGPPAGRIIRGCCSIVLIGWLTLVGGACVLGETRAQATNARQLRLTKAALVSAGDADSLAAAAMMFEPASSGDAGRLSLIERAVAAAPDRPDLLWLNLQICNQLDTCDPTRLAATLHKLDPGNGAVWALWIARSDPLRDQADMQDNMRALANSENFDVYWNTIIVHATNAMLKTKTLDARSALVTTIGYAAASAIPDYQRMSNDCKGEALEEPAFAATCQQVARVMRRGDTYLTELIGASIAKRVWPPGSEESRAALDERRVARYRMDAFNKTSMPLVASNQFAEKHLRRMAELRTEQDVMLAEILDAGLNPNPPADWMDP